MYVKKGDRIRAAWLESQFLVSLAGMQMKVQAIPRALVGVVRHLRGDDQTAPSCVRIYVDPEGPWSGSTTRAAGCTCDHEHVEIDPQHVIEVLP